MCAGITARLAALAVAITVAVARQHASMSAQFEATFARRSARATTWSRAPCHTERREQRPNRTACRTKRCAGRAFRRSERLNRAVSRPRQRRSSQSGDEVTTYGAVCKPRARARAFSLPLPVRNAAPAMPLSHACSARLSPPTTPHARIRTHLHNTHMHTYAGWTVAWLVLAGPLDLGSYGKVPGSECLVHTCTPPSTTTTHHRACGILAAVLASCSSTSVVHLQNSAVRSRAEARAVCAVR